MLTIYVPDDISLLRVNVSELPDNWNEFPYTDATQSLGNNLLIENKYCVFQIPSAVVKGDFILLINPRHSDFAKIKIINTEKFQLDKRLFE
jgi:RES domain-containing protein